MTSTAAPSSLVITPEQLLQHWQAHRGLTRRVIDAFPDDAIMEFRIGDMRPFAEMVAEFLGMSVPSARGLATGEWISDGTTTGNAPKPVSKAQLLERWDADTAELDRIWPTIPAHRFQEVDTAFGQWTMPGFALLLYVIDNEIHHRGQGYVYLRALGIEPPPFYDRY